MDDLADAWSRISAPRGFPRPDAALSSPFAGRTCAPPSFWLTARRVCCWRKVKRPVGLAFRGRIRLASLMRNATGNATPPGPFEPLGAPTGPARGPDCFQRTARGHPRPRLSARMLHRRRSDPRRSSPCSSLPSRKAFRAIIRQCLSPAHERRRFEPAHVEGIR